MSIWVILILLALASCMIGCLFGIFKATERLANGIFSIRTELVKMNAKLERIEAVSGEDSQRPMTQQESDVEAIEAIEAAISNFESLKRIDLANPLENK
jgi:hypothetical protein